MKSALRNRLSAIVQRSARTERRCGKRLVPCQRTLCLFQLLGETEQITGVVQNLSFRGVGVVVEREFRFGLDVSIRLLNASYTFSVTRELKVVRCLRLADKQYLIAGPFDRPLRHEEVVPFLI